MGHYRSEMGFEDDDRERARREKERRDASAAKIQKAIDERGIAAVLAEMLAEPTLFAIRYG